MEKFNSMLSKPVQILANSNLEHTDFFLLQNVDQASEPHTTYCPTAEKLWVDFLIFLHFFKLVKEAWTKSTESI